MVGLEAAAVIACSSGGYVPAGTDRPGQWSHYLRWIGAPPHPQKWPRPVSLPPAEAQSPKGHIHMTRVPEWAIETLPPEDNDGTHIWHVGERIPVALDLPRSVSHNPHLDPPSVVVVANRLDLPNDDGTVTEGEPFYWVDLNAAVWDLEGTKAELARAFESILAVIPDTPA